MKYLSYISILFLVLALDSCKDEDFSKVIKEKRENILGTWTVTQFQKNYSMGELLFEPNPIEFEITFTDDGTGIKNWDGLNSNNVPIKWLYEFHPEKIIINHPSSSTDFIFVTDFFFDISTNTPNQQIWKAEIPGPNLPTSAYDKYDLTWEMIR